MLMISANMAILGLLKIKVFWNKGYDIIISIHDVTNKFLSNFYQEFDQKNRIFWVVVLVQVQ